MKQELSYDPWGRLRNPDTQAVYVPGSEPVLFLSRGYTGHEHLAVFGLINMNARLYDPALGRFLSPDPYVQTDDLSQNYNRYSYCLNNPLRYSDPSGKSFADWWKRNIADPFMREWNSVFGGVNGFEIGYNSGGGGFINATRGGQSFGPSMGYNGKNITGGNVQGGFHSMSSITQNTYQSVSKGAEQIARELYFSYKQMERSANYLGSVLYETTPVFISIGGSVNTTQFWGQGGSINIAGLALIMKGDPGLYYIAPGYSIGSAGKGESASATLNLQLGYYTGNDNDFRSDFMEKHSIGVTYGIGDGTYAGGIAQWAPKEIENPFGQGTWSLGGQYGFGYGEGYSVQYTYTTKLIPIFTFKDYLYYLLNKK